MPTPNKDLRGYHQHFVGALLAAPTLPGSSILSIEDRLAVLQHFFYCQTDIFSDLA
jgi:hypothetical protein